MTHKLEKSRKALDYAAGDRIKEMLIEWCLYKKIQAMQIVST